MPNSHGGSTFLLMMPAGLRIQPTVEIRNDPEAAITVFATGELPQQRFASLGRVVPVDTTDCDPILRHPQTTAERDVVPAVSADVLVVRQREQAADLQNEEHIDP